MKATSLVGDYVRRAVNAPRGLLESCWMLVDQEMMLDVAAAVAATEPEVAATLTKPAGAPPALTLHWAGYEQGIKKVS